jgi:CBS domain containing-hemolysin-like protein
MQVLITTFKPLVWLFTTSTDLLFKLLGMPLARDEKITSADILAMTEAGARAGVLAVREQQVIANVFELDTRLVSSVMTSRERIAWFLRDDPEEVLRARIVAEPFSAYPVCDGDIDHVLGYVDAKDMFQRVLSGQPLAFGQGLPLHKALVIPDRLSLTEVLEQFQQAHEDFAIIVNEYSLVVGVITLNDVMSTVMGDLVGAQDEEQQIVRRDENSWLIDGVTPVQDVQRALDIEELPHADEYETLAGFLMVMLRRVPKRTDSVTWAGYTFEVLDVDSYRIDQVMVTRATATAKTSSPGLSPADGP